MAQFWTIESPDGPYTFDHPQIPDAKIASLFHHKSLADDSLSNIDRPHRFTVFEVADREEWASMIVAKGITHIDEHVLDTYHQIHEAEFWRATLRTRIMGR